MKLDRDPRNPSCLSLRETPLSDQSLESRLGFRCLGARDGSSSLLFPKQQSVGLDLLAQALQTSRHLRLELRQRLTTPIRPIQNSIDIPLSAIDTMAGGGESTNARHKATYVFHHFVRRLSRAPPYLRAHINCIPLSPSKSTMLTWPITDGTLAAGATPMRAVANPAKAPSPTP